MKSKLTSLPDHTKILVGGPWRKVIIDIPEFLSVGTPIRLMNSSIVNSMMYQAIPRNRSRVNVERISKKTSYSFG